MKLHRAERDNYVLAITTEPEVDGTPEASFDDGETWVEGTSVSAGWSWLVYGPDFDPDDVDMDPAGTALTASAIPLVRLKDDPVSDIERGPTIRLWG